MSNQPNNQRHDQQAWRSQQDRQRELAQERARLEAAKGQADHMFAEFGDPSVRTRRIAGASSTLRAGRPGIELVSPLALAQRGAIALGGRVLALDLAAHRAIKQALRDRASQVRVMLARRAAQLGPVSADSPHRSPTPQQQRRGPSR